MNVQSNHFVLLNVDHHHVEERAQLLAKEMLCRRIPTIAMAAQAVCTLLIVSSIGIAEGVVDGSSGASSSGSSGGGYGTGTDDLGR